MNDTIPDFQVYYKGEIVKGDIREPENYNPYSSTVTIRGDKYDIRTGEPVDKNSNISIKQVRRNR